MHTQVGFDRADGRNVHPYSGRTKEEEEEEARTRYERAAESVAKLNRAIQRHGTRSQRDYEWFYYCNVPKGAILLRATPKTWAKARRVFDLPPHVRPLALQRTGRVVRACYEFLLANWEPECNLPF
jgi:hypothetical protein